MEVCQILIFALVYESLHGAQKPDDDDDEDDDDDVDSDDYI